MQIISPSENGIFRIDIPRFPKFHYNSIMESINRIERTIYTFVNLDGFSLHEKKDILISLSKNKYDSSIRNSYKEFFDESPGLFIDLKQ